MGTLNVRIDEQTAFFVADLASRTGRSKSDIVREALEAFHGRERAALKTPAEAMAHLIGSWDSGGLDLSERTGERFAQILAQKGKTRGTGRRRPARRPSGSK
jgi:hypothetical protein